MNWLRNLGIVLIVACSSVWISSCSTEKSDLVVRDASELKEAIKKAQPGDTVYLAKGEWKDAELKIVANGVEGNPIVIAAEEPGQTKLTGGSYLRLGGNYVVVSGLHFTKGFTPTSEVISFKKDKKTLANNCRITNCAIDNYSNPEPS